MSVKEWQRLEMLARVRDGDLWLMKAAVLLRANYLQLTRTRRWFQDQGYVGHAHGSGGLAYQLCGRRPHKSAATKHRHLL